MTKTSAVVLPLWVLSMALNLGLDECCTFNQGFNPPAYYGVENYIDVYSKDK